VKKPVPIPTYALIRVTTLFVTKNSKTFPGLSKTPEAFIPGPCRKPAMFKYSGKQELLNIV